MRYGIFSDIHSNLEALEAVIKALEKEEIDCFLCGGDIVGYAADPRECLEMVRGSADFVVAGNHDFGCAGLFDIEYFNPQAKEAILWTRDELSESQKAYLASLKLVYQDKNLALVHGSLFEPEKFYYLISEELAKKSFVLQRRKICFVGHSHVPGVFIQDKSGNIYSAKSSFIDIEQDKSYIINVGSVGQPRDLKPGACFCIYDTEKKCVSVKRLAYDIKQAQRKIIEAGLPEFLATRLSQGI